MSKNPSYEMTITPWSSWKLSLPFYKKNYYNIRFVSFCKIEQAQENLQSC